ncbi:MAG: enoyl-CoA hydratase/isomerase family protein [Euryarchaeota archaeon]|nr:enoyl-CoA hydratase/isomerase family protein [Euryarchaeota archaeon]
MGGTATTQEPVRTTRDGPVATITLDRPQAYNSFDVETLRRMLDAVQDHSYDPDVRAVVLTGTGKTFCTGADLTEMKRRRDDAPRLFDALTLHYHAIVEEIRSSDTAFVAAVNGVAAGGGVGLALACDLVVADPRARLQLAYANLGVSPDGGASAHLVRAVGPHRAREALLLDDGIDATRMLVWGLANRIAEEGAAVDEAHAVAVRLAERAPYTVKAVKNLVERASHESLHDVLDGERRLIIDAAGRADFQEGLDAFLEKRRPRFTGR